MSSSTETKSLHWSSITFILLQLSLWNHHVKILSWPIIITVSSLSLHISQAAPLSVWSCWRHLPRQILSVFNPYLFSRLSRPLPTTYLVIITINSMLLLGILVGSLYRLQLTSTFFFFSDQCSSVSSPAGRPTPRKKKIYIRPLKDGIYDTTSPIDDDRRDWASQKCKVAPPHMVSSHCHPCWCNKQLSSTAAEKSTSAM
jgi:hypothetical protein